MAKTPPPPTWKIPSFFTFFKMKPSLRWWLLKILCAAPVGAKSKCFAWIRRSRLMVYVGPLTRRGYRLHKIWDSILWHMKIVHLFLLDRNMVGGTSDHILIFLSCQEWTSCPDLSSTCLYSYFLFSYFPKIAHLTCDHF